MASMAICQLWVLAGKKAEEEQERLRKIEEQKQATGPMGHWPGYFSLIFPVGWKMCSFCSGKGSVGDC